MSFYKNKKSQFCGEGLKSNGLLLSNSKYLALSSLYGLKSCVAKNGSGLLRDILGVSKLSLTYQLVKKDVEENLRFEDQ